MALSIKRLRWVLAAGALLLIGVLTVYIGYGRYLAMQVYTRLLHHAGATISRDTNGITYSQTQKGRTVFTLHAKTATQLGEGKYDLHGVNMTLYSRDGKHTDYINGDEFTYDENEGLIKAIGEVHMDLQAPQSLTTAGRSPAKPAYNLSPEAAKESDEVIHVRTSGLEYLKKLGVATTSEPVEFHYNGIECTAVGAEFDTDENVLSLLSNVVANGLLRGQPVTIHAVTAQVDRTANIATLTRTVAESKGQTVSADLTVLNLRKDGSIASAKATGHVLLTGKTQRVTSSELDARFNEQTVPQTAQLSGGVQLTDSNALRPVIAAAAAADVAFDPHGAPASLSATGVPHVTVTDKRAVNRELAGRGLLRELHGDRIVVKFVAAPSKTGSHTNSQISDLHAIGSAEAHGESVASVSKGAAAQKAGLQLKTTTLTADDLDMTFVPGVRGQSEPHKLFAVGHTLLRQDAPAGEQETSVGDKLDAVFSQTESRDKTQLGLESAVQTGHVVVHRASAEKPGAQQAKGGPRQHFGSATADRASYDGATEKLTLSGSAHLTQDNATVTAATVVLDERTQDADALGNVQATLEGNGSAAGMSATSASRATPFTHVLSASAHFTHGSGQAEFRGTDTQPAKMWHEASQVQAATLLVDNVRRTLSARGVAPGSLIHAVFAGTSANQGEAKQGEPRSATQVSVTRNPATRSSEGHSRYVRVAAAKLDYSDAGREAVFTGPQGVTMEADSGTIKAQRAVAYLQPASAKPAVATEEDASTTVSPFDGSLDHVVITGDVLLDQPGRHGMGEELIYTAATGDSVLTGSQGRLPKIVDAQQGSITGASLLFGDAGSTIIVSGESSVSKAARVHTETHIQGKADAKSEARSESKSKEKRQ